MEFDNTLIEIQTYQICFVNAKLNLFNDFFKGTWKTMFEEKHGKLKQLDFEQRHLWSGDIGKLIQFLNKEINQLQDLIKTTEAQLEEEQKADAEHFNEYCPKLQQKLQNARTDWQFVTHLLKELPPIQEKDVWFLFQKKVETIRPPLLTSSAVAKDFEKEDAENFQKQPVFLDFQESHKLKSTQSNKK